MKNKYVKSFGFTIVELMVVMAMISIISVLAVANYHRGNRQAVLDAQAAQFAQDLRRVQEWALAAREIDSTVSYGYGIYVDADKGNSYILYSDDNNNGKYQPSDRTLEAVVLNEAIEISNCFPAKKTSINYIAPDLTAQINNGTDIKLEVMFRVKKDPAMVRTVIANIAGLVYVQ